MGAEQTPILVGWRRRSEPQDEASLLGLPKSPLGFGVVGFAEGRGGGDRTQQQGETLSALASRQHRPPALWPTSSKGGLCKWLAVRPEKHPLGPKRPSLRAFLAHFFCSLRRRYKTAGLLRSEICAASESPFPDEPGLMG